MDGEQLEELRLTLAEHQAGVDLKICALVAAASHYRRATGESGGWVGTGAACPRPQDALFATPPQGPLLQCATPSRPSLEPPPPTGTLRRCARAWRRCQGAWAGGGCRR